MLTGHAVEIADRVSTKKESSLTRRIEWQVSSLSKIVLTDRKI